MKYAYNTLAYGEESIEKSVERITSSIQVFLPESLTFSLRTTAQRLKAG